MKNTKEYISKDFIMVFSIIFFLLAIFFFYKENLFLGSFFFVQSFILIFFFFKKPLFFFSLAILWRRFAYLIGSFLSPIFLHIFYIFIFVPFSLLVKIFLKDILDVKLKKKEKTFWKKRLININSMKKQF